MTNEKLIAVCRILHMWTLTAAVLIGSANLSAATFVAVPSTEIFVAREVSSSTELNAYYRDRAFQPIWVGGTSVHRERLASFFEALGKAVDHGLPDKSSLAEALRARLPNAITKPGLAEAEIAISRAYLEYAREIHSGLVDPRSVSSGIDRRRNKVEAKTLLDGVSGDDPAAFVASLPPSSLEYRRLRKELKRLRNVVAAGGWGAKISENRLTPGDQGQEVVELRDRLIRMRLVPPVASSEYSGLILGAVQRFQARHGLGPDGIVGTRTIRAINTDAEARLAQILVALERARWLNLPLGRQHVIVNLADFRASVIDDGLPVFTTKVVVGNTRRKLNTPEFSDTMTYLVVNPSWRVPRSIVVDEVLPELWNDPLAEEQLEIFHPETGPIDRTAVDFTEFTKQSFPFEMRQPPGPDNALGLVKFMFPNKHSIYMHDTPEKQLFNMEIRAFSHGCVRLERAFDFAHFLLSTRVSVSEEEFQASLESGEETEMPLDEPLPVHITYQTAWVGADGTTNFREDIYGRDHSIFQALQNAGVLAI